jgi:hypothetical protein
MFIGDLTAGAAQRDERGWHRHHTRWDDAHRSQTAIRGTFHYLTARARHVMDVVPAPTRGRPFVMVGVTGHDGRRLLAPGRPGCSSWSP